MSSPSDRDIIKQEVSRKCFKRTISLGDELLLNGLSRIARLQITSDQPVGILYGRDESSATNQSNTTTDEIVHGLGESSATNTSSAETDESEKGSAACQFSPISSVMGKLFVLIPWVRSSIIQVNIIGKHHEVSMTSELVCVEKNCGLIWPILPTIIVGKLCTCTIAICQVTIYTMFLNLCFKIYLKVFVKRENCLCVTCKLCSFDIYQFVYMYLFIYLKSQLYSEIPNSLQVKHSVKLVQSHVL